MSDNLNIAFEAIPSIPLENDEPVPVEAELPPYTGFGSVEDSLGSCKYLVLQPPKKDFIKMLENEHKVLRFVARLESKHKEDKDRRFVISYRLADDMMTIYEPPQRNAGILGGKFMERTRVLLPGSSLLSPQGPLYYNPEDLFVGGKIEVLSHHFVLLDADEFVFNYMETTPAQFKQSNPGLVFNKIKSLVGPQGPQIKAALASELVKADTQKQGLVDRKVLLEACKGIWKSAITEHVRWLLWNV